MDRLRLPGPGARWGSEVSSAAPGSEVEKMIACAWKEVLELETVGIHDNFFDVGGNSLSIIRVTGRLKEAFNRDIPVTALFNHPTIAALAAYLREKTGTPSSTLKAGKVEYPQETGGRTIEIAVIGMSGRFPGARNLEEFWDNLIRGRESIAFLSEEETEAVAVVLDLVQNPDFVRAKGGLEDDDVFDAAFFGYNPAEAGVLDPQVRVFHECAWEALEDAGYNTGTYRGRIGLYAGATQNLLWQMQMLLSDASHFSRQWEMLQFIDKDYLSVRISYKLNLKGAAVAVQTACSTSLVAIDTACQALLESKCDMALAGGVSITSHDAGGYLFQEGMVMSPDGHCRVFDAAAGGIVGGNGAGIVVLKPLAQALQEGDHIYAVIKGSAVNNDGAGRVGFTAPGVEGQAAVVREALHRAQVEAETISYVETHGTGTKLGDPIEVQALVQAFATDKKCFCALGSVKANIGHLDAAAGAAGFIKTVLALKHRKIPPSLHFETPNPQIDFKNSPFVVNTHLMEWKTNGFPRRAGVSSFGIGGTNAHVILEEAPPEIPDKKGIRGLAPLFNEKTPGTYQLILLSAKTQSALEKMTKNLAEYFKKNLIHHGNHENPVNPGPTLADAAYTLQVGRKAFRHRQMLVCSHKDGAVRDLSTDDSRKLRQFHVKGDRCPVVFMFAGLGSQYVNMGLDLYRSAKVFREEMDRCFEILTPLMGFDPKEILYPHSDCRGGSPCPPQDCVGSPRQSASNSDQINQTEITPPLIFAFEYSLAKLLIHWGIKPDALMGYSFGEYAAACLSGVFSPEDGLRLVWIRSRLIGELPEGAMLSVPLEADQLKLLLNSSVYSETLSIAIDNGPSCIVAGRGEVVKAFEQYIREKKYLCLRVNTSHALHSPMMEPVLDAFEREVRQISLNPPVIPYISNVTGDWVIPEEVLHPGYWGRHLSSTVQFARGVKQLIKEPGTIFVEIGPGRDLSVLVDRYLDKASGQRAVNLVPPWQKEVPYDKYLLTKLGQLWLFGVEIDWEAFYVGKKRQRLPLPTYPFEGQRYPKGSADIMNLLRGGTSLKPVEQYPSRAPAQPVLYQRPELSTEYHPPTTKVEQKLVETWQSFFKYEPIGIDDDFFELGGDSLKATTLIARIYQELEIQLPLEEVFNHPTIKGLSGYIKKAEKGKYQSIEPAEELEFYPLSASQKRMFILNRFFEYNLPMMFEIEGSLDRERFEEALQKLVERHESLRTSIEMINGEPVQRIHNENYKLQITNIMKNFLRPFDLSRAPLLRVGLLKESAGKHILLFNMHHIVSDGTSLGILTREFFKLYQGEELPRLVIRYRDFSQWERKFFETGAFKQQENYWLRVFSGEIPVLNMPLDYPRPPVQSFESDVVHFNISGKELRSLKTLLVKADVSLYMVLMAIFNTLLFRYTGQEDIVVGSIIAGRKSADLENLVGVFINTLAIRNHPAGDKPFNEFLQEVRTITLEAFQNQDYPFGELLEKVNVKKDLARSPLFEVMLILQNMESPDPESEELRLQPYDPEIKGIGQFAHAQHDLTLWVVERQQEEILEFHLQYCTALFKKETVQRLAGHFLDILHAVKQDPVVRLSGIDMIGEEEKRQLLIDFNDTAAPFARDKLIHRLFADQVAQTPDSIAVIGAHELHELHEKGTGGLAPLSRLISITYKELNNKSNQLAHQLREKGVKPDTIVGIMMRPLVEMIIGLLGILKAGGAYLPVDPDYPEDRIDYMLADTSAKILVTDSWLSQKFEKLSIVNCQLSMNEETTPAAPKSQLAYIIYTSGTSGRPKGVMVDHGNLRAYVHSFWQEFEILPADVMLQQTSFSFDAFAEEIYPVLLTGAKLAIPGKDEVRDIHLLTDFIVRHGVTIIDCTPLLLNEINRLGPGVLSRMSVHTFISGGDELKTEYVERLLRIGKVYNTYGPTETTVCAAYYRCPGSMKADLPNVPLGKPITNYQIYILDAYHGLLPIGVPGELCIAGVGVTRGYLNNPELTAEKFDHDLWDYQDYHDGYNRSYRSYKSYIIYKTGDLARWLPDGNIEFLGRIDQQVKIRGFRIELGEIESHLLAVEGIKQAVVALKTNETGDKYLCAYVVGEMSFDVRGLKDILLKKMPTYMVPMGFVRLDRLPMNPSGKVDIKALPEPGIRAAEEYVAPVNEIEKQLVRIWSEILALDEKLIGTNSGFFDLGGHSILAIRAISKIKEVFNVEIPLATFFQEGTPRGIAEIVSGLHPGYRDAGAARLKAKALLQPFDLEKAPLLRTAVVKLDHQRCFFFIDMHHIITDGMSIDIIAEEFVTLYQGGKLEELPVQYKDFSQWQAEFFASERFRQQEQYWLDIFKDETERLNLPLDFPRPQARKGEGKMIHAQVGPGLTMKLKGLAAEQEVTLFMLFLAAYTILLARITGQEDIVVGTPVSGRTHVHTAPLVGMLVNTLALRNKPGNLLNFSEFLNRLKEKTLSALENQDYPFDVLVEKLGLSGEIGRNPLVDTMFTLETGQENHPLLEDENLTIIPYYHNLVGSMFDLVLSTFVNEEIIRFTFIYDINLFKEETVREMSHYFLNLLNWIFYSPGRSIGELDITVEPDRQLQEGSEEEEDPFKEYMDGKAKELTDREKEQLLRDFNDTDVDIPDKRNKVVHRLFEGQVEKTPDHVALIGICQLSMFDGQWATTETASIAYKELNEKANRLAWLLRAKGVGPDCITVLIIDPSIEMMVGILGILKAGSAYLPIDPEAPRNRILSILEDSAASFLLTKEKIAKNFSFNTLKNTGSYHMKPRLTAPRPQVKNFDALPYPDRSLVDYEKYHQFIGEALAKHTIELQATRGCPFRCAFCHKIWPKNHVRRSAENIFNEINNLYHLGVKRFVFVDDIFNLDKENSERFFRLIIENGLKVQLFFTNGLKRKGDRQI
ncbi:MAG: amino acid adenylation domain-containing protein [Candidatus Aminicenantes bacterium]|nr:MAG: amino acid adenylation domain-containing protein [Candidatus Aminicenantes bacterium]